ncbi:membrane protein insertase YidC [candidate division KSB1 bacterium]|nr:membrane protein insertase YidC [candidate division KSB1 bacterium]
MEFDKKTIVAFLIIGLILIVLQTDFYQERFLPQSKSLPTEEQPAGTNMPTESPSRTQEKSSAVISSQMREATSEVPESKYGALLARSATSEEITVETSLYTAVFSTRGGSIKSFLLKKYLLEDGSYVELIGGDGQGNLGVLLPTEEDTLDTSSFLFSANKKKVTLSERKQSDVLEFVLNLDEYRQIKKTFTFYQDRYDISMKIDLRNIGDLIDGSYYYLTWRSGVESTEPDLKADMQNAKAYALQGDNKEDFNVDERFEQKQLGSYPTDWVAIKTKYFTVAVIPQGVKGQGVRFIGEQVEKPNEEEPWKKYGFDLKMPFNERQSKTDNYTLYFGPLDYDIIKSYGFELEQIIDLGPSIFRPFGKFVLWSFRWLHSFIPNYGWVIVIFSILIKLMLFPLTKKSYKSMKEMQALQPIMQELNEKYKDNAQKKQQEVMKLYKEYGVNPLGGCIPMVLQMPLLIALFNVFRSTIELRGASFIWWITDLARPDTVAILPFTIPLYGNTLNILPLFMGVTMFIQQKISMKDPKQKAMVYFMPLFLTLLFNSFPSGLNLYYALFNILSIMQEKLIPYKIRTPEEMKAHKAAQKKTKKKRRKYDYRGR